MATSFRFKRINFRHWSNSYFKVAFRRLSNWTMRAKMVMLACKNLLLANSFKGSRLSSEMESDSEFSSSSEESYFWSISSNYCNFLNIFWNFLELGVAFWLWFLIFSSFCFCLTFLISKLASLSSFSIKSMISFENYPANPSKLKAILWKVKKLTPRSRKKSTTCIKYSCAEGSAVIKPRKSSAINISETNSFKLNSFWK